MLTARTRVGVSFYLKSTGLYVDTKSFLSLSHCVVPHYAVQLLARVARAISIVLYCTVLYNLHSARQHYFEDRIQIHIIGSDTIQYAVVNVRSKAGE